MPPRSPCRCPGSARDNADLTLEILHRCSPCPLFEPLAGRRSKKPGRVHRARDERRCQAMGRFASGSRDLIATLCRAYKCLFPSNDHELHDLWCPVTRWRPLADYLRQGNARYLKPWRPGSMLSSRGIEAGNGPDFRDGSASKGPTQRLDSASQGTTARGAIGFVISERHQPTKMRLIRSLLARSR